MDPVAGRVPLEHFARDWLNGRPTPLRPRVRELYEYLLRKHITPALGRVPIGNLAPATIRAWHAGLQSAGIGPPVTARAYRLLRAILNTAVEDRLIANNPCNLKGAGVDRTPERPIASIEQVYTLAAVVDDRFRALVLLAAFTTLREAELFALTRRRIDLERGTVEVAEQLHTLRDGRQLRTEPKTDAGRRVVSIPAAVVGDVADHLCRFVTSAPDSPVFTGDRGSPLRRSHWARVWRRARDEVGLDGFRFHDLRHTGNTLAAETGASTKQLMARMGHASSRAALIYQHATRERDEQIARQLSDRIDAVQGRTNADAAPESP